MAYENLEFVEAIESLASFAGVQVQYENSSQPTAPQHDDDYALMNEIALYYQQQLKQSPSAIDYLKQRGLSGEMCKLFGIGFAPNAWDSIAKHYSSQQQKLQQLGMTIQHEKGHYYDRFRHRIMFPIQDRKGRTIAFGGRVINNDEQPKYLNSPETPIYHKGDEIYGLYQTKKSNKSTPQLILVEGYMDVLALFQHGITYAVACLGTALTTNHIKSLFRHTQEIIFCFDGDNAGRKAADRALNLALPLVNDNKTIRFLFLENGLDPDQLLREKGKAYFLNCLEKASAINDYFFQNLKQQVDRFDVAGKAKIAQLANEQFKAMPDTLFKTMLINELAALLNIEARQIQRNHSQSRQRTVKAVTLPSVLERSIALVLQYPQALKGLLLNIDFTKLTAPGITLLSDLSAIIAQHESINSALLIEALRTHDYYPRLQQLLARDFLIPEDGIEGEFQACLKQIRKSAITKQIDDLMQKANQQQLSDSERRQLQQLILDQR